MTRKGPGVLRSPAGFDPREPDPDLPVVRPRTLLVQDPAGDRKRDEASVLIECAHAGVAPRIVGRTTRFREAEAEDADLVIFDWGGLMMADLWMEHEMRALRRWAEDHPARVVAVWSVLPWSWLEDEVKSELPGSAGNVVPLGAAAHGERHVPPRERAFSKAVHGMAAAHERGSGAERRRI